MKIVITRTVDNKIVSHAVSGNKKTYCNESVLKSIKPAIGFVPESMFFHDPTRCVKCVTEYRRARAIRLTQLERLLRV